MGLLVGGHLQPAGREGAERPAGLVLGEPHLGGGALDQRVGRAGEPEREPAPAGGKLALRAQDRELGHVGDQRAQRAGGGLLLPTGGGAATAATAAAGGQQLGGAHCSGGQRRPAQQVSTRMLGRSDRTEGTRREVVARALAAGEEPCLRHRSHSLESGKPVVSYLTSEFIKRVGGRSAEWNEPLTSILGRQA